jgi:glycosyltransferase involved in cell wall biosynthesis
MKSVTVIIPTTGSKTLKVAIESLANQTYSNLTALIVIDGKEYRGKVDHIIANHHSHLNTQLICLSDNVGANGYYGHRIYAAFSHLVNCDYVLFLDQDCFYSPNHISSMVETLEDTDSDWVYSLRNITDLDGNFLCEDNCESLGKWQAWTQCYHIDTNCYCLKREVAVAIAGAWHGGWGQDRVVFGALKQYFPKYECTGDYTVNYRLDGNPNSVTKEFFEQGNQTMIQKYDYKFPWSKYNG